MEIRYTECDPNCETEVDDRARFWHACQDEAYRLLSLRPGERVELDSGRQPDEEGWSSVLEVIQHHGDHLSMDVFRDGRDCDGRLSSETVYRVNLDALAAFQGPDGAPLTPAWAKAYAKQQDHTAEAAGY